VDGYVYNAAEEPKILMTGKWNESLSYQPCDLEGEPLPGTELKEVSLSLFLAVCTLLTGYMDSLVNFVSSMRYALLTHPFSATLAICISY
jgi:hypothetical protein